MAKVVVLREILSYSHLISLCFINVSKFLYVSSYFPELTMKGGEAMLLPLMNAGIRKWYSTGPYDGDPEPDPPPEKKESSIHLRSLIVAMLMFGLRVRQHQSKE
jgi:hypothetical protein